MAKLNQVLAVEKEAKNKTHTEITRLHKANQTPGIFNGFIKRYERINEDGENYPDENQMVQMIAEDNLNEAAATWGDLFEVTAQKDWANCSARANVVVDGKTIINDAPATYLLFLEKRLDDVRTFVDALPVLDNNNDWSKDEHSGIYRTGSIKTHKTKKVQRPIVKYDATPEHPAQTELISEDQVVGYWNTIKQSGAIAATRKRELLKRVDKLSRAVKYAREEANAVNAEHQNVSDTIFEYILGS